MSERTVLECDNCKKFKDKVNHWYRLSLVRENGQTVGVAIVELDSEAFTGWKIHACGQSCATEMVARFLSTGTIERT